MLFDSFIYCLENKSARRAFLVALLFVLLNTFSTDVGYAQVLIPGIAPPPANAIALEIQGEADAALAYAKILDAVGDPPAADFQRDIAHRRGIQAAQKYQDVVHSATYGQTPYAPEAVYYSALVQEKYVDPPNQPNNAVLTLTTLHKNYATMPYPDKAAAALLLTTLENQIDTHNKTHSPESILYGVMDFLVRLTGKKTFSYAIAIFLISIIVKLSMTPLSNKQYASMREMQRLQPILKELQAKYKNDKEAMQRKTMEVYKQHNVNPMGGCLPVLVTLPVMYLLYYTIRLYQYQFTNGGFLWIGTPLSHQFPDFLATNLSQQDIPLLVLYGISMYVTQKITVQPSVDPQQAEQQRMMSVMTPFISTWFFLQYQLPSAFILYYLIFNVLSTAQQVYFMRAAKKNDDIPLVMPNFGDGDKESKPARFVLSGDDAVSHNGNSNGQSRKYGAATPAARGVMAPKVHPKKKRR